MTSHFASFLNKTNIFHVVVDLYSNRTEMTSKCVQKINDTLGCASCATSLFLPRFDVVLCITEQKHCNMECISKYILFYRADLVQVSMFTLVLCFLEEEILLVDLRALGAEIQFSSVLERDATGLDIFGYVVIRLQRTCTR